MYIAKKIYYLSKLGNELKKMSEKEEINYYFTEYENIYNHNPWFIRNFVEYALKQWAENLNEQQIYNWLKNYNIPSEIDKSTVVAIICAGNIPLVGLHDIICCYLSGVKTIVKLSSKDNILMKYVIEKLYELDSNAKNEIKYTEDQLSNINAIIATGTNNTNQYFEEYFGKYPHIFRKNKNSLAVITEKNSIEDLKNLADDIFLYFGLGCRSVSKIFIPKNFDFNKLETAFCKYKYLIDHHKYYNNLTYQYALMSMNQTIHINCENILLIENQAFHSAIGVLNYEYYSSIENVNKILSENTKNIQCIVSNDKTVNNALDFGHAQQPNLSDYADNIDTIKFLLNIRK